MVLSFISASSALRLPKYIFHQGLRCFSKMPENTWQSTKRHDDLLNVLRSEITKTTKKCLRLSKNLELQACISNISKNGFIIHDNARCNFVSLKREVSKNFHVEICFNLIHDKDTWVPFELYLTKYKSPNEDEINSDQNFGEVASMQSVVNESNIVITENRAMILLTCEARDEEVGMAACIVPVKGSTVGDPTLYGGRYMETLNQKIKVRFCILFVAIVLYCTWI